MTVVTSVVGVRVPYVVGVGWSLWYSPGNSSNRRFIARCMRARAHRKRNAIRQPMRVPPENVAVLAANFVAAIAVISLNKRAFVYFPFPVSMWDHCPFDPPYMPYMEGQLI